MKNVLQMLEKNIQLPDIGMQVSEKKQAPEKSMNTIEL